MTRESALRAARMIQSATSDLTTSFAELLDKINGLNDVIKARDLQITSLLTEIDELKERNMELEERLLKLDDIEEEDDTLH